MSSRFVGRRMKTKLSGIRLDKLTVVETDLKATEQELTSVGDSIKRVVEVLDSDKGNRKNAIRDLGVELNRIQEAVKGMKLIEAELEQHRQIIEVATDQFKESGAVVDSAKTKVASAKDTVEAARYALVDAEQVLEHLEEFLRKDPNTIHHVMDMIDANLLRGAFATMDEAKRKAYRDALDEAEEHIKGQSND